MRQKLRYQESLYEESTRHEGDEKIVVEEDDDDASAIGDDMIDDGSASSSSFNGSSSSKDSSEEFDDASSSSTSSSTSPVYDLSELMAQLPIKKGLSKFYEGKSQSFTSVTRVTSLEDLAKKASDQYRRKFKACKSYGGGGLNKHRRSSPYAATLPRPTITKKASTRASLSLSLSCLSGRKSSFC
ncbi:hypothetical protein Dimus_004253 [Dionaea muscipula]